MENILEDKWKKVYLVVVANGLLQRICNYYGNMASADF